MKKSRNYLLKIVTLSIVYSMVMLIEGCLKCSPSGRRSHQKANSHKKTVTHSANRQRANSVEQQKIMPSGNKSVWSLNELYNTYSKSVFIIYTTDGNKNYQGSGFFISKNGLAVSNYHVFKNKHSGLEIIKTLDGKKFKISEILEKSDDNDYIVFRVKINDYNISNPIPIVSQTPQIGEDVFAIGNPKGLESTLSRGIISAFRKDNSQIQTTTEITHGSSGGPLLNMKGEVVGITSSGLGEANLNFAVNIKILKLYRFK